MLYRRKMRNPSGNNHLTPGDLHCEGTAHKDTSLYNKQQTQTGYLNRQISEQPSLTGGYTARQFRDNEYSYLKEMSPVGTTPDENVSQNQSTGPIYQVQNIRAQHPNPSTQSTSQSESMGSPSNPCGIEYIGPNVNPLRTAVHLGKGKKNHVTEPTVNSSVESDEGKHIYEYPDGISDYKTISAQYFELDNKGSHKLSLSRTGTESVKTTKNIWKLPLYIRKHIILYCWNNKTGK